MNVQKVLIKYDGELYEFDIDDLDMPSTNPTDLEVKNSVIGSLSRKYNVTLESLAEYVVVPKEEDRNSGLHDTKTVINIMPDATYG